jgi:pimeloyl-ACP methyl ester carboxylesterase
MQDGVVLLHGISRTARSFGKMETALVGAGFVTLNLDYASRRKPLSALAEDIRPAIKRFAEGIDGTIHFVGHSMGGLLARVYLAKYRPQRLGRVVMLGTPNGGSEIADGLKNFLPFRAWFGPAGQQLGTERDAATHALLPPIDYPVGIVAGNRSVDPLASVFLPRPHDGRVSVANTKLDGMVDHVGCPQRIRFCRRTRWQSRRRWRFCGMGRSNPRAFFSEVGTGSPEENASKQKATARF